MRRLSLSAIAVATIGLVGGAVAFAVIAPQEAPPPAEGATPATLKIPGFDPCGPVVSAGCAAVWINMDFHAQLTHDGSVRYPEDLGLPECPPPVPDPGFAPGQEVPDEAD